MAPLRLPAWSAPSWLRQHSANKEGNEDLPSEAAQPSALHTRKSDARLIPPTLSSILGESAAAQWNTRGQPRRCGRPGLTPQCCTPASAGRATRRIPGIPL
jgi:hypothetical protein